MFVASWQVSYNKFKPTATLNSINNYGGLVCRLVIFLRVNIWKLRNFVSGLKNESVLRLVFLINPSVYNVSILLLYLTPDCVIVY